MTEPTQPRVSIGLPVYNGEHGVARAIETLLAQDYPSFELIISNNASTDGTAAICERYAKADPRVRYSVNETNIGANGNFYRVLHLAKGEYFMWAACDDAWGPTFVSKMVADLDRLPAADVTFCAIECVNEDGSHLRTHKFRTETNKTPDQLSSFELFKRIQYGEPHYLYLYGLFRTAFMKRAMPELLPEVPSMDVHFLAEIALATRFGFVDEVLHTRVVHPKPAYKRYPAEKYSRLMRDGEWTPAAEDAFLREYLWNSPLIPLHRKLLALTWLRCRHWNLGSLPGGGLLHRLNRALSRKVG